ncbi:MAG: hypothetical protein MHPSP_004643, partial [Paramarteilia canceri]
LLSENNELFVSEQELFSSIVDPSNKKSSIHRSCFAEAIKSIRENKDSETMNRTLNGKIFAYLKWTGTSNYDKCGDNCNKNNYNLENFNPPSKCLKFSNFTSDFQPKGDNWVSKIKQSIKSSCKGAKIDYMGLKDKTTGNKMYLKFRTYPDTAVGYMALRDWKFEPNYNPRVRFITNRRFSERFP